jgi:hypothetical protein
LSTNEFLHASVREDGAAFDANAPDELRALADAFVTWIQRPTIVHDDEEVCRELAAFVADSPRMLAEDQIEAYRVQYLDRLSGALEDDFRAVARRLGTAQSRALVADFLAAQPPPDWNLYTLGAGLPAFLATQTDDAVTRDLARLEWAFCDAFGDADGTPLTAAALAAVDTEALGDLVLAVQPALRLVELDFPLCELRIALRDESEEPKIPESKKTYVVVARDHQRGLEYMYVTAAAYFTLTRLRRGEPLGAALEGAAEDAGATEDEMLGALGTWFQNWTAWGWLVTGD